MAEEIILEEKADISQADYDHKGEQRVSKHRTHLKIASLHLQCQQQF